MWMALAIISTITAAIAILIAIMLHSHITRIEDKIIGFADAAVTIDEMLELGERLAKHRKPISIED